MGKYEVTTDGENVVGPVTLDQVRRGLAAGKIPPEARIRRVGDTTWHPVLASITWIDSPASSEAAPRPEPTSSDPRVRNWMQLADAAQQAGNHDEAYRFFTKVLEVEPGKAEAWFGKATAAGWNTNLRHDRYPELILGMTKAVQLAADPTATKKAAAAIINDVTVAYFELSKQHTMEFISLDGTWEEHVQRCISMLHALQVGHEFDPVNQQLLGNGIDLAKAMLDGVWFEHEFKDGQMETTSVPPELEKHATRIRNGFIAALQKLDPNYQAEKVEKVGAITATGCVGCLVIVALVGGLGWWLVSKYVLGRFSGGDETTTAPIASSHAPRRASPSARVVASTSRSSSTSATTTTTIAAVPTSSARTSGATKPKQPCDPNCFYNMRCMIMSEGPSSAPCCQPVTKVMDGLGPDHLATCRSGARDTVFPTDPD